MSERINTQPLIRGKADPQAEDITTAMLTTFVCALLLELGGSVLPADAAQPTNTKVYR